MYKRQEDDIRNIISESDGTDNVSIYLETEKAIKHLPMSMSVCADKALLNSLYVRFGRDVYKRQLVQGQ